MRLARYIPVAATVVIVTGVVAVAAPAASADLLQLPSIESESVSHVTPSDATLEAEVNLHEVSTGAYYQFQIVKDPSEYGTEIVCPSTRPQTFDACVGPQVPGAPPIGFLPGNSAEPGAALSASLDLTSAGVTLKPGTTYHYRVLVARRVPTEDTIQWEPPTVYGADQTFTTPPAPAIENESVSHITPTDATIEAQINTGGRETTYEVWVGNYPECIEERMEACKSSSEHPILGTIAAGSSSPVSISVDVAKAWHKLSPTSYIYHVDATNSNWAYEGSAYGENKVFTTPAVSPPAIEGESVSNLSSTDATLEATINDEGLEATYEFHLLTAPACLTASPPCERPQFLLSTPAGTLLASGIGQSVSVDLNDVGIILSPGERYEYWVTAISTAGTTQGQSQAFTALADAAQPQGTALPPSSTTGSGSNQSSNFPSGATPAGLPLECLCDCARGCHATSDSTRHLSRGQKLTAALAACARKPKRKRSTCAKKAYKKYGTTAERTGARASKKR